MKKHWLGDRNAVNRAEWIGFLDKEVKLDGTLELAGTFRIDGEIKGVVRSKDCLILGENARVLGSVEGEVVSVAGQVNGDVHGANRVEILPGGVVEGDVFTPSLVIQPGGVLEGRSHMRGEIKLAAPELAQPVAALASEEVGG